MPENIFTVQDSLPLSWDWMEVEVPVADHPGWTSIKMERTKDLFGGMRKNISVKGSPMPVSIEVWLDQKNTSGSPSFQGAKFVQVDSNRPNSLRFSSAGTSSSCSVSIPLE